MGFYLLYLNFLLNECGSYKTICLVLLSAKIMRNGKFQVKMVNNEGDMNNFE